MSFLQIWEEKLFLDLCQNLQHQKLAVHHQKIQQSKIRNEREEKSVELLTKQ
jgi:hypothetical protein